MRGIFVRLVAREIREEFKRTDDPALNYIREVLERDLKHMNAKEREEAECIISTVFAELIVNLAVKAMGR